MKKLLGYTVISSPFVALTICIFLSYGIESVIIVFGSVAIFVGLIYLGIYLINDD